MPSWARIRLEGASGVTTLDGTSAVPRLQATIAERRLRCERWYRGTTGHRSQREGAPTNQTKMPMPKMERMERKGAGRCGLQALTGRTSTTMWWS
jgi:hypothetical protein